VQAHAQCLLGQHRGARVPPRAQGVRFHVNARLVIAIESRNAASWS
jgi:hypothetical protein